MSCKSEGSGQMLVLVDLVLMVCWPSKGVQEVHVNEALQSTLCSLPVRFAFDLVLARAQAPGR